MSAFGGWHKAKAGAAFTTVLGSTSSPEVPLFKRFKQQWEYLDHCKYSNGMENDEAASVLNPVRHDILQFAEKQLADNQPRDDYKEMLQLSIIFLGGIPPCGIKFMAPGPMHHARWMSKVIYALKVWMFRDQFQLTPREEKGLRQFCLFAVTIYLKAWFTAPLAACAPRNDLQLLKDLQSYQSIHTDISKATTAKLGNHLWYLSDELVGLAFFDRNIAADTKRKMVKSLQDREGDDEPLKRIKVAPRLIQESDLQDFVSQNTSGFFNKLGISTDFLEYEPETWSSREDFTKGEEIIKAIRVTNDHAERAVALVQEYNRRITHDEDQLQFLLQVVSEHRRQFPDSKKSTLTANWLYSSQSSAILMQILDIKNKLRVTLLLFRWMAKIYNGSIMTMSFWAHVPLQNEMFPRMESLVEFKSTMQLVELIATVQADTGKLF